MKNKLLLLIISIINLNVYGQVPNFIRQSQLAEAGEFYYVLYAADLNDNDNIDILTGAWIQDEIIWYKNDGSGTFGSKIIIDASIDAPSAVFAADLNDDSFLDIIVGSQGSNNIKWFKNNGSGFFTHQATFGVNDPRSLYAADIDDDGDVDMLSASSGDNKISWYESSGGSNPTFTKIDISTTWKYPNWVHAADVDGDGDMDVLAVFSNDDTVAWYENDGATDPSFTEIVITSSQDYPVRVFAGDFNSDTDLDVLIASSKDNTLAWYENDGAINPSFSKNVISSSVNNVCSAYVADLDKNNHLDVLSASFGDGKIAWYKNDGATDPIFTEYVISDSATGAVSVIAADLDNDTYIDVITIEIDEEGFYKIYWYKNDFTLSVQETGLSDFKVYPIPTKGILNIESKTAISKIEVLDYLGQWVMSKNNSKQIDISNLSTGIYFCKVTDAQGNSGIRKIVKQ